MERIAMSIEEDLAREIDRLIEARGYASRSEAMRDLLPREVEANRAMDDARSHCVASLSYVYNHHERRLADRLMQAQHRHHDLVIATTPSAARLRPVGTSAMIFLPPGVRVDLPWCPIFPPAMPRSARPRCSSAHATASTPTTSPPSTG